MASVADTEVKQPTIDKLGRAYGTGRRKNAIARVWVKKGKGKIIVNGREVETYFARPVLRMIINQPFVSLKEEGKFIFRPKNAILKGSVEALKILRIGSLLNLWGIVESEVTSFLTLIDFILRGELGLYSAFKAQKYFPNSTFRPFLNFLKFVFIK
jgi:hypothetical protein